MEDILNPTRFHDSPPPWLPEVEDLRPGAKRRLSDARLASFNGRAYHVYDFREKSSEVYEPQLTLAQRLLNERLAREQDERAAASLEFPSPAMLHTKDWPAQERAWMHVAGLNNDDIHRWGAAWVPDMGRVVLPLRMLDGTAGWIGRKVGMLNGAPKYLFPTGMRRGGGAKFIGGDGGWDYPEVVIVEDALSAWRVAQDTNRTAIAALGTSLDRDAIVSIAAKKSVAIVWLDPDKYGQLGAHHIRKQLGQLGVEVRNVISERDPKLLSPDQIRSIVNG